MATNNAINLGRHTFSAVLSTAQNSVTGDGTAYHLIADTVLVNEGGYDSSTGVFTAPVTGNYCFNGTMMFSGINSGSFSTAQLLFSVNGSTSYNLQYVSAYNCAAAGGNLAIAGSYVLSLTAGDTVALVGAVTGGSKIININASNFTGFGGFLVL